MKAVGFRVTGRVQGVGYRAWTQREGRRLGLDGWVRNLQEGAVEGVAQGADQAVDQLLAQLQRGPTHAVVARVRVQPLEPQDIKGFSVLPTAADAAFLFAD